MNTTTRGKYSMYRFTAGNENKQICLREAENINFFLHVANLLVLSSRPQFGNLYSKVMCGYC